MKHWRRVVAFILTLLLAIYGLPVAPAAQASRRMGEDVASSFDNETPSSAVAENDADVENTEEAGDAPELLNLELPDTKMRFIQTGFDPETGILTMSLQIRVEPGEDEEELKEGVFVFQTDASTVRPITNPRADFQPPYNKEERREIYPFNGQIAVVASDADTMPASMKEFMKSEKAKIVSNTGLFNQAMSAKNDFLDHYTGYMVSGTRMQQGETTMLDCYLQFYCFGGHSPEIEEDGYATVIDLDFRLYKNGVVAQNTDGLSAGSIQVPQTAREAREIVDQFSYEDSTGKTVPLAMGGAGFIQRYLDWETYDVVEGQAFYYYDEPQLTPWKKNGVASRVSWSQNPAQKILGETAPGVWYENFDKRYVVDYLLVDSNNTVRGDTIENPDDPDDVRPVEDPDFEMPTNSSGMVVESERYPRYSIPDYELSQQNDEDENWIPESYQGNGKRPPLKYFIMTSTSDTSISSPEHDGFEEYFTGLKWEFLAEEGLSLEDCEITEESGEGRLIPTYNNEYYRVKEATFTGNRSEEAHLKGKKLWTVYKARVPEDPSLDEYMMRTPVGVVLDMIPTEITYWDHFQAGGTKEIVRSDIPAPQFHITHDAADLDNYLWYTNGADSITGGQKTKISLRVIYDPEGTPIYSDDTLLALYKADPIPTSISVDTEGVVENITNSDGQPVEGFWVGNTALDGSGEETPEDAVSTGIEIHARLLDQYRAVYHDKWANLELVPTEKTKKLYDAAGKTCPFEINQKSENSYTIIYRGYRGVNDVVEGEHILRATYSEPLGANVVQEIPVFVSKPKDKLTLMKTYPTNPHTMVDQKEVEEDGVKGTVYQVVYEVPPCTFDDYKVVTNTENILIAELANQWRNPEDDLSTKELAEYDLASGIRNTSGTAIDLAKARAKGYTISYEVSYPDDELPQGISVADINQGKFTYNSYTKDGSRFNLRITATYQGWSRFVEYQFEFTRQPRILQQILVVPPDHQTGYTFMVPLKEEGKQDNRLTVIAVDQYGSQWDWNAVMDAYKPGSPLNPEGNEIEPWSVFVEGELPPGVTLTTGNNPYITVDSTARTSSFKIYAKFAACRSKSVTVEIKREPSKPTIMRNLVYNTTNSILPPIKSGTDAVYAPSVEVYDQYDERILDCKSTWRYTVTPASAKDYISVDSQTGELTVKKCAPNCDVFITSVMAQNGSSRSLNVTVQVRRQTAYPDFVEIKETEIPFLSDPSSGSGMRYLTASGTTQYGEDQVFEQNELTWRLDAVKFPDATLYRVKEIDDPNGGGGKVEVITGDIPFDSNGGIYNARNVVSLTSGGALQFNGTVLARNIPQEMTVTVICKNGRQATKTIKITRDPSVPTTLYFPGDFAPYNDGVQIPESGKKETVPLRVYVRDQYGVILEEKDAPVKWSAGTLPKGVTMNAAEKTVTIDHTASPGSVKITATCGSLKSDLYLGIRQDEPLAPRSVEFTNIKNSAGKVQAVPAGYEMTLPLPPQAGRGYETYTAVWIVRDQFENPISKMVRWTVENPSSGVKAEMFDEYAGMVRVYYTAEAMDALRNGQDLGFTLRGSVADDAGVYRDLRVHLSLDDAEPAYAVPVMTDPGDESVIEGGVVKPVVPPKGDPARAVTIEAKVYDQYGREMPNEAADIKLATMSPGLRLSQTPGTNRGTLYIESNTTAMMVTLQSTPKGEPESLRDESSLLIVLSKGTAYAYELALAESNQYTFDIPYWNSRQLANKPDEDHAEELTLRAEVVDQYGAWMKVVSDLYHPVWEFVGDHEGVEFASGDPDGDGIAEGEDVTFAITNRAVPAGKMSQKVTLRLTTTNMEDDEDFVKTLTLDLRRDKAEATYLYITGSDENGVGIAAKRPYAEAKTTVYPFDPVVYDQYGAPIEDCEIEMDMDLSVLEGRDDLLVEEVYRRGESAENGNSPVGYQIYQVVYKEAPPESGSGEETDPEDGLEDDGEQEPPPPEILSKTLLAEFDCPTGNLTLYTACDCLDKLAFTAKYEALGEAGFKRLIVPIAQEETRAYKVEINRTYRDFVISGNREPIQDYVYPVVYDQYGGRYDGYAAIQWNLKLPEKDEKGNYLPYIKELDEEGNERLPDDFLVIKEDAPDRTTTLTIQPESFISNKVILLECLVLDTGFMNDPSRRIYEYSQISVHRPYNTGVTVTFDAGEYGKLVGESQVSISSGEAPLNPPGVKTVQGYGFVGWTSDGEIVVDATKVAVFSDLTYVAVYKDVTNTKFLEGYGDRTIRPENKVTRAEFVSMVVRAIGGFDSQKNYGKSFKDVAQGKWYSGAIAYAKQKKIIDGYEDGTFRPNAYITRGEAARILADAAGLTSEKSGTFEDVRPGSWYEKYIEALLEAKVVDGYEDGTYRPENRITRAEAIKLIVMITKNALNDLEHNNIQKYAYCPFIDIKRTHWAYAYVLRAAGIA